MQILYKIESEKEMLVFATWPEAIVSDSVHLMGTNYFKNMHEVSTLYAAMSEAVNPYGDGKACSRIVETFL